MAGTGRLVDRENRRFNPEWTENYFFHEVNNKPVCLICSATVSVKKSANLKRHHRSVHTEYDGRFPTGTARRQDQLNRLLRQATGQMNMMRAATTLQENSTTASYEVSYLLAKAMAPYRQVEVVKKCLIATALALFPDKREIHQAVEGVQLSRNTCTRRVADIAEHLTGALMQDLARCEEFAIAVDESTDINDVAQLSVFVRYYLNGKFNEDLLTVIPLAGRTTGDDIYQAFKGYMESNKIPLARILAVVTDGAPSMVGVHSGFVTRLKEDSPHLLAFHCIIHETVLCSQLKDEYGHLMLKVMKLINFLKSKSALRHRQLRKFLQELDSQYDELLVHNNVRWLSKGKALERVWALRQELDLFLSTIDSHPAEDFLALLRSETQMKDLAFLVDILGHMNKLNLQLQGEGRNIVQLWETVVSFLEKLNRFREDISGNMIHFTTLKEYVSTLDVADVDHSADQTFICDVISNVNNRFSQLNSINYVIELVSCPFRVANQQWKGQMKHFPQINVASVDLELCDFNADITAKAEIVELNVVEF